MGLVRTMGRTAVIAGTASAVSGRVQRRQQEKWADQEPQQAQEAAPPAAAPAAVPAAGDEITQIRTLAGLVGDGILSSDDFFAKVKQILGM
ncbi:MAG: SHOCT domain-containing protein [Miltoncostaeaceae bacterium]